jgi:hypothetical protein
MGDAKHRLQELPIDLRMVLDERIGGVVRAAKIARSIDVPDQRDKGSEAAYKG